MRQRQPLRFVVAPITVNSAWSRAWDCANWIGNTYFDAPASQTIDSPTPTCQDYLVAVKTIKSNLYATSPKVDGGMFA